MHCLGVDRTALVIKIISAVQLGLGFQGMIGMYAQLFPLPLPPLTRTAPLLVEGVRPPACTCTGVSITWVFFVMLAACQLQLVAEANTARPGFIYCVVPFWHVLRTIVLFRAVGPVLYPSVLFSPS